MYPTTKYKQTGKSKNAVSVAKFKRDSVSYALVQYPSLPISVVINDCNLGRQKSPGRETIRSVHTLRVD